MLKLVFKKFCNYRFRFNAEIIFPFSLTKDLNEKLRKTFTHLRTEKNGENINNLNRVFQREYEKLLMVDDLKFIFHKKEDESIEQSRKFADIRIYLNKTIFALKELLNKEVFVKTGKEQKHYDYIVKEVLKNRK